MLFHSFHSSIMLQMNEMNATVQLFHISTFASLLQDVAAKLTVWCLELEF